MGSAHKKIILRTKTGTTMAGYLPLTGFVRSDAPGGETVEVLDLSGRVVPVELAEVKTICYVGDFNLTDTVAPERLLRRSFLARPRSEGLWVRVTFLEGDQLEGLAALDLSLLGSAIEDKGVFLIPPDIRSNTQRVFVPLGAMSGLQVLAVVTTPSKAAKTKIQTEQEDLFSEAE